MPEYRRPAVCGGQYFLTLVTHGRRPLFEQPAARRHLRHALAGCRRDWPFGLVAVVLLRDHLHLMLDLPAGDANVSVRVARLKAEFTRRFLAAGGAEAPQGSSRGRHRHRGVWQRRFYDHLLRDGDDVERHRDYLLYNPVRHCLARCPHDWPHSSFHRFVALGLYDARWGCACTRPHSPAAPGHAQRRRLGLARRVCFSTPPSTDVVC